MNTSISSPSITFWIVAVGVSSLVLIRWLYLAIQRKIADRRRRQQRHDAVMSAAVHWYRHGTSLPRVADPCLRHMISNTDTVPLGTISPEQEARFLRNLRGIYNDRGIT